MKTKLKSIITRVVALALTFIAGSSLAGIVVDGTHVTITCAGNDDKGNCSYAENTDKITIPAGGELVEGTGVKISSIAIAQAPGGANDEVAKLRLTIEGTQYVSETVDKSENWTWLTDSHVKRVYRFTDGPCLEVGKTYSSAVAFLKADDSNATIRFCAVTTASVTGSKFLGATATNATYTPASILEGEIIYDALIYNKFLTTTFADTGWKLDLTKLDQYEIKGTMNGASIANKPAASTGYYIEPAASADGVAKFQMQVYQYNNANDHWLKVVEVELKQGDNGNVWIRGVQAGYTDGGTTDPKGSKKVTNWNSTLATSAGVQAYGVDKVVIWIPATEKTVVDQDCGTEYSVSAANAIVGDIINLVFDDAGGKLLVDAAPSRKYAIKCAGALEIVGDGYTMAQADFDKLNLDGVAGGLTIDAKGGLTIGAALLSKIKAAGDEDKFIFLGSGSNGATLDFNAANNSTTLQTHLVFKGGTHLFKHNQAQNSQFGRNGTLDNPVIFITDNATLNFEGHDLCGYGGTYDDGGVVLEVDDGATLNLKNWGTFFFRQQICIVPGGTVNVPSGYNFEIFGGSDANEIYVPDSDTAADKVAAINGNFRIRVGENSSSIGVYVGKNSKLKIEKVLDYKTSSSLVKRGEGALEFTGNINSAVEVAAGSLIANDTASIKSVTMDAGAELDLSDRTALTTPIASGDMTVTSGVAIRFPNGFAENATVALCGGALSAPAVIPGAVVYLGDATDPVDGAALTYDAENKTVAYSKPTITEINLKGATGNITLESIINAVEAQMPGWTGLVRVEVDDGAVIAVDAATTIEYPSISLVCAGSIIVDYAPTTMDKLTKFDFSGVAGGLTISGTEHIATAELAAKDATFVGDVVYEFDATTANYAVDATLKTMILSAKANRKFVFLGAGEFGASLGASGSNWSGTFSTQLVFCGGKHAIYWSNGNALLGDNGTIEAPTILVDGNATFDFYGHDITGWSIYVDDDELRMKGVVRVSSGSVLNMHRNGNGTVYYNQLICLEGGAKLTSDIDGTDARMGGAKIVVPAQETIGTPAEIICTAEGSGKLFFGKDIPKGAEFFIGANAKLKITGAVESLNNGNNQVAGGGDYPLNKTGDGVLEITGDVLAPFNVSGGSIVFSGDASVKKLAVTDDAAAASIEVADAKTVTINTFDATGKTITKTNTGTLTINAFADKQANTFVVDGGTLIPAGNTFDNAFTANANGTVKFAANVSESAEVPYRPTIGLSAGTIKYELTVNGSQVRNKTKFNVLTLPEGMTKDDIVFSVINADTGNEVDFVAEQEGQDVLVYANVVATTHEFTPTESGTFTWTVGGEFGEGTFKDYDNATFNGSQFATEVTVGSKIEAGSVEIGGDYTFSGSPIIASSVNVTEGAKATFANNLVADTLAVGGSEMSVESVTASEVALTDANFKASVLGPSMKFVRLSITATQGAGEKPAVGEFRLYRGNAATGYTIVDWPIGTKISESTGLKATKETEGYPAEVGAGLGNVGGNECQPGVLIDGYYGNVGSPKIYGEGAYNTPAYNKWWPTSQAAGPWVVTIEFPYPVATFSGCNFCLADHGPRNPTAWTIEVSGDGINWTPVNETTSATWSGQHAWAVATDKPDNVAAENWPAFLNGDTTPTVVAVGGTTTIVADGSWTADLEIDGDLTLKGVPEKYLTLDAASSSAFAIGAKLTFDLSAYSVTKAGKQYVVAGPLAAWPAVGDIDVLPEGMFELGKDDFGYFVEVVSGNYWLGNAQGVGTWDLSKSQAWGEDDSSATPRIWLNGVAANFMRNGTVTVDGNNIQATAINLTEIDEIEVELKGTLATLEGTPINFASTNDTLIINNDVAFAPGAITEVVDANGKLVKKGAGTLTLGANNTFTGGTTIEAGVVVLGAKSANAANGPLGPYANNTTDWTVDAVVKSGATLDLNGKDDMTYVFELENGATLKNTGADIGTGQRQTKMLTLSGDATVVAVGVFGLHNGGNAQTKLELNDYTLTKTGTNAFELVNTEVSGAGAIDVQEGILWANTSESVISEATLKIAKDAILRLDRDLTAADVVFNGAIEGEAELTVNGTLSGAGIIPNLTLGEGATADLTAMTVSNLTFDTSMTLVLGNTPTAASPVRIVEGEFEEMSFFDTVVTVKVGDATLPGEYMITQNAEGMFVTESTVRRWTGNAGDSDWSNVENWNGSVPGEGNLAIVEVNGNMALTLPAGGVGTLPELRLDGSGTIALDATKLTAVEWIVVDDGVTIELTCDADAALTLVGGGALVKQGTGTLTLEMCGFATATVEAGALDFFVDEGETLTVVTAISGAGAAKKTGAGELVLSGANTFAGGAEIVGGTLKAGVAGTATSSAVGTGTLKIGEGATFDIAGLAFSADGLGYAIESAGAITSSTGDMNGHARCVKSLTLTGDITASGNFWTIGLGDKAGKTSLVMNGYTLTVKMNNGNNLSIEEAEITGGGEIDIQSGCLRTNGGETYADGKIKLNGGSIEINIFEPNGAAMSVKDFEYVGGEFINNNKLVVTGTLTLTGGAPDKVQLADGATVCLTTASLIDTVAIPATWGVDGKILVDATDEMLEWIAPSIKKGIDTPVLSWSDAFDPSVIKTSDALKEKLANMNAKLVLDKQGKCLKLTRSLGFMIMLK